jgi:hypothetical protein
VYRYSLLVRYSGSLDGLLLLPIKVKCRGDCMFKDEHTHGLTAHSARHKSWSESCLAGAAADLALARRYE